MLDSVRETAELRRIRALPRRDWQQGDYGALTPLLARPGGTMSLRVVQGAMLNEAFDAQGLLAAVGVGRGKTLPSLLAPYVLESQRPMLVLPAALIEKTRREWIELSKHWKIPRFIRLVSYQWFGRVGAVDELDRFNPDLLFFDECHYVKNKKAAVTRRFDRFIKKKRELGERLVVCAASGTITARSLHDFAHIIQWCLPTGAPVPWTWHELEQWSRALDANRTWTSQIAPGALLSFCDSRENGLDETSAARVGFGRRLAETPGVITTTDDPVKASLFISPFAEVPSTAIDEAFTRLRKRWELPDGKQLIDGIEVWRHAREMALGFYYIWDPWPEQVWLNARLMWARVVRAHIARNHGDSEQHVREGIERGLLGTVRVESLPAPGHENGTTIETDGRAELAAWRLQQARFKPNKRAVWLDDAVARAFAQWARAAKGIVWTEHTAFGRRVAELANLPYYGRLGLTDNGRFIDDEKGSLICSMRANIEGRNLQWNHWRNLMASCPSSGKEVEQWLGRTHREGQPEDTVTAEIYCGAIEHVAAWETAMKRGKYMQEISRQPQKIVYADNTMHTLDALPGAGSRWVIP